MSVAKDEEVDVRMRLEVVFREGHQILGALALIFAGLLLLYPAFAAA